MTDPDAPTPPEGEGPARTRRPPPVRHVGSRSETPPGPVEAVASGGRSAGPSARRHETAELEAFDAAGGDPASERRAERLVSLLFLLSAAATVVFVISYATTHVSGANLAHLQTMTVLWGLALFFSLFGLGTGVILWAKRLMVHETVVQDREPFASPASAELATEEIFLTGASNSGIGRRPLLRRTLLLASGLLALPAVQALRDLGPAPKRQLRTTVWKKGARLVDLETGVPVRLGDVEIGGLRSVMPEGFDKLTIEETATASTVLIRLRPGEDRPLPGRENWSADGHVAYSKICTHAGCPVGLYEQQTHHLFCPCHQSTFIVTEGCKVIFGPAARALPQLAIAVDPQGYLVAQGPYTEPVGPSFWERG